MPQRRHSLGTTALALVLGSGQAAADAVLDGTTGSTGTFSGDFVIPAGVGELRGDNLFHSFERFSVRRGESATFTGPAGIDNVISRVTGGEVSRINGLLASEIPGTDFFFLNPAGVIFGPEANLDIDGSFHVSTADQLRFEDGNIFSATNPNASSFTVAAPEAFGFLGADAGPIVLSGAELGGRGGETISLVGGDITLERGGFIFFGDDPDLPERGDVTLVAMSRPGTVAIDDGRPSAGPRGFIQIQGELSGIDVSGVEGAGDVRIQAGRLDIARGSIVADNLGESPNSGAVRIRAGRVRVADGGLIQTSTEAGGNAGNIVLRVEELSVLDDANIFSGTFGSGDAGDVSVLDARRVLVSGDLRSDLRTDIASSVEEFATGEGGKVIVEADEVIVRDSGTIFSSTFGAGDAGSVSVTADAIRLETGGQIGSGTLEPSTGSGGEVIVIANDEIVIRGVGQIGRGGEPEPSGIFASTESTRPEVGPAGDVTVRAPVVRLADRGEISSESIDNPADGGRVTVVFEQLLEIDGGEITTQADFADAGDIRVAGEGVIEIRNGGEISTEVIDPGSMGNAGDIRVRGGAVVLNGGDIVARGIEGQGGNIDITAEDTLLQSQDSTISALSQLGIDGTVEIEAPSEDVTQQLGVLQVAFIDISSLLKEACAARAARGETEAGSLALEGRSSIAPPPDAPLPSLYGKQPVAAQTLSITARALGVPCG